LNEGLGSVRGDLIAMISSDDLWAENKLELQVKVILENPALGYVLGLTKFVLIKGETPPRAFRPELFEGAREAVLLEVLLARRALVERVGNFNESLQVASDVDWFARLGNLDVPHILIPQVLLYKRIHANNLSTAPELGKTINHEILSAMRTQMQRRREMNQNE
jgi:hypothetical protein